MSEELDIVVKALAQGSPIAAALWVGKPLIDKLLGPTAEYLGGGTQHLVQRSAENIAKVIDIAIHKAGRRLDDEGQVSPKILKAVVDNAAYNEDQLTAEYYGGVLASSRTSINRDDRGALITRLIGSLSTYQLRAHYIFYSIFFRLMKGSTKNLGINIERNTVRIYIPMTSFYLAMDMSEKENFTMILGHIMTGLSGQNLIDAPYASGNAETLKRLHPELTNGTQGIIFQPHLPGIELFLWAQGRGDLLAHNVLTTDFTPEFDEGVILPEDALLIPG
jgi:hypothetical protein